MRVNKSVVFFFGMLLLILMWLPIESTAGVNVNVGIFPPLPVFRIHTPPPMVVIPGTYIYSVPDVDVEILFYQGYWYRPNEGRWYRSKSYNGPWGHLESRNVPRALFDLPPEHYRVAPEHKRIPYGHFRNNWGKWERERYWDRDERWREGRRGGPERRDTFGPDHGRGGPPPPPPGPPNKRHRDDYRDRRDYGPHGR